MISEQELIAIGTLIRTHGTSGELQCRMRSTAWEDNDPTFIILSLEQIFVPFRVTDWRTKGSNDVLLTLQGIRSEQAATRLIGSEAYMLRSDLPAEEQEQTDLSTLIGYSLHDTRHGEIGTITAIDTSTLNTLIELSNGTLLPLHEDFIVEISQDNKRITTRFPQGLLE